MFILLQVSEILTGAEKVSPFTPYVYGFLVLILVAYIIYREKQFTKEREDYREDLLLRDKELKEINKSNLKVLSEVAYLMRGDERSREEVSKLLALVQSGWFKLSKNE